MSPAAAVMLNFEVSLVHDSYMEEGATLARTLLPYLNKVTDYRFLSEEADFIGGRFLAALITHVRDTTTAVGAGFVLYGLKLNARLLQGIFDKDRNTSSLREALTIKKFPPSAVTVMCLYPAKFLWTDLLNFWEGKNEVIIAECTQIIAKMNVITDPGLQMNQLLDVLAQRGIFA